MKLTNDERDAIISYRSQKSKDTLAEAEGIATLGFWNAVTNRLYYACYYILSALLIKTTLKLKLTGALFTCWGSIL